VSSVKKEFAILGALFLVLVLVVMAFPLTGLATTYPITVIDDLGREVTFEALPERIISLAPSNTEILFELGLGDKVIGVTDFCDYPPEALEKESVGGPWGTSIDVEKIVALQPDLILAEEVNGKEVIDTLEGLGFSVFGIKSTDLNDLLDDIRTVGQITDKEAEADELTAQMTSKIRAITGRTTWLLPEEKPRILHICWHDPIYTSGQGTFINDLIEKAGGVNIFADLEGWPAVDIEAVIGRDPEVIIVTAMGGAGSTTWDWVNSEPRLKDVSARNNGRIYYIESNWLERPGPRMVLGLEAVAKYLHPEIFFEPYDYDTDGDEVINKAEAIKAIQDYSSGLISKAQAIQVVMLYFEY
jgi:iron complex transport system substrate-binding protein